MGAEFLFMDDNARPHRANIVVECLQSEDITRMDWPEYSPDLNPIEHRIPVLRVRHRVPFDQVSEFNRIYHDERLSNCCVMHRHTGTSPATMVCGGIAFRCYTLLVHIAGTLDSNCYISEMLDPCIIPYIQRMASAIWHQPLVTRNIQESFYLIICLE
ncbi:transposable element Tcb1 transposase [Trichonephila clavipes]|uniref:Transposable element Tcb1 transposase n=1 Tax=Trichonephila clavipes TaxID=2585209 RepID=A0A8X6SMR2_TRICX|nr:transposable element Tcb1 transposase [Trichonephila clavipes]